MNDSMFDAFYNDPNSKHYVPAKSSIGYGEG